MNLFKKLVIIGLACFCQRAMGQGIAYPLSNEAAYNIVNRLEVLYGRNGNLHTNLKTYSRGDVIKYVDSLQRAGIVLSERDKADIQYLYNDNNEFVRQPDLPTTLTGKKVYFDSLQLFYGGTQETASTLPPQYKRNEKPLLKYFYKTPAHFFEIDTRYFDLKVSPILNLQLANAKNDGESIFTNVRGVELRGSIDDRLWFYTNILESQANFPDYVRAFEKKYQALPGNGVYKPYELNVLKIKSGYDFLNAQGYIGFNVTPHIGLQIGHGRNFIGNGYRSLLLSDFSNNYFHLKINTRVWKFHYQNIFAEINKGNKGIEDDLIPKKYTAIHHLSYNITPSLNIGIFESVVFSRNNDFELQYLNPIIFYRSVEHSVGSPDNVILGTDVKWNFLKHFSLYGQFVLDEFKAREYSEDGWWGKKFGSQIGLKYMNVGGIDHLDFQIERNQVRPYTYTHYDSSANFSHQNQALAHPLGANFKEWIFRARYQPLSRLILEGRLIAYKVGEDEADKNWGNDINLPNETRVREFGNNLLQGVKSDVMLLGFDASYQLYHNMFLDFHIFSRQKTSADKKLNLNTFYIGGGFRMNINNQRMDF